MSRAGAMIDDILAKVEAVRPDATLSDQERIISKLDFKELPICMVFAPVLAVSLAEYRQREETTTFALAYVQEFGETDNPQRSLLDTAEAISEGIWDGNAIDTDAAGYFAHVTRFDIGKSSENAARWALVMEVTFETMDAADSAFALVEDPD